MSLIDDLLTAAKGTLQKAGDFSRSIGGDQAPYPRAAQARAAYPGAYDDLTDEQLEAAIAKKQAGPTPVSTTPLQSVEHAAGTFLRETPLNPVNAASALLHPIDTLHGMIAEPIQHLQSAVQHGHDVVNGTDPQGRLAAGEQAVSELVGAIPVIGPSIYRAANKAAQGDYSGAAGSVGAVASGFAAPEATQATGRGSAAIGRGLEAAGNAGLRARIPQLAAAEAILRGDPKGAVIAAAPYGLKYAGKGLQRAGNALAGLGRSETIPVLDAEAIPDGEFSEIHPRPQLSPATFTGPETLPTRKQLGPAPRINPDAEAYNLTRNAPYGEGAVINSNVGPTERLAGALSALETPINSHVFDLESGTQIPRGVRIPEDLTFEAGDADRPGLTIGEAGSNPLRETASVTPAQLRAQSALNALRGGSPDLEYRVNAGGDHPVRPIIIESRLPDSLRKDVLDLDQAYTQAIGKYPDIQLRDQPAAPTTLPASWLRFVQP